MLSEKLNVGAQGFTDDVHVTARSLAFLAQLRFGREGWQNLRQVLSQKLSVGAQCFSDDVQVTARSLAFLAQLLFGRERRDSRRDGEPELLFGREGWQNLLHPCEPAIEIFEMSRDHGVVHQPHLPENDGGERTAILASSWRGNDRAATPKKGPYPFSRAVKGSDGQETEGADRDHVDSSSDDNGESFFVRHAYFTGGDGPYEKLKRALRAEIDEGAWSILYSTVSRRSRHRRPERSP